MPTNSNALNNLATVSDALKMLGLHEKLCEDPAQLIEDIDEVVAKFLKETADKMQTVLSQIDFNRLLFIAGNVLASSVGGLASAWYDKIVNNFIGGKIVGSTMTIVSSVFASVPGALLFFQYAAVDSLRENLRNRNILLNLMVSDIRLLIDIINSYMNLFTSVDDNFNELDDAIDELTKAIRVISMEINRSEASDDYYIISKRALEQANTYVENSINSLTLNGYSTSAVILDSVHRRYNLKTKPPTLEQQLSLTYWFKYFEDLNTEIINCFSGDELRRVSLYLARELFPFFPRFLQLVLLQSRVNQATVMLQEKTPTFAGVVDPSISVFGVNISKSVAGDTIEALYGEMLKFFGYKMPQPKLHPFYKHEDTKDLTVQKLNSRVKFFETSIVVMQPMWDFISKAAEPYLEMAKIVDDKLIKTRSEMIDFRESAKTSTNRSNQQKFILNKTKWISQLTEAKGILGTGVGDYSGFQIPLTSSHVSSINGLDVANLLHDSNIKYVELQNYIISKKTDDDGNLINSPAEIGYGLSQTAVTKTLQNLHIIAAPKEAVKLIAELKAVEFTYKKQIESDLVEYKLCNEYISILESSKVFKGIKTAMRYYIDELSKIPTMTEAMDDLLGGNLMGIAQGLGDVSSIASNISSCVGAETPTFSKALDFLSELQDDLFLSSIKNVENNVVKIKVERDNFEKQLSSSIDSINDAIDDVKNNKEEEVIVPAEGEELLLFCTDKKC